MADDLFKGRPDGPRVARASDVTRFVDDDVDGGRRRAAVPVPERARRPAGAGATTRVGLVLLSLVAALVVAPRAGLDETYTMIYVAFAIVFALTWAATTVVALIVGVLGLRSRSLRAAPFSWVAAVPLALLWGLALAGVLAG